MSYMDNTSEFAMKEGIQEMSFGEADQVEGGIVLELAVINGVFV